MDQILDGWEIFCTYPGQPCDPFSHMYSGHWISFPGVKQPGCGTDHPPPSGDKVKERVELYLSTLPLGLP